MVSFTGKQLLGKKFRRQYSVGPYCIDFCCVEIKLAVELDGESHFTPEAKVHDAARQRFIESFGIRFLRFTNVDVYDNLEGVLETLAKAIHLASSCKVVVKESPGNPSSSSTGEVIVAPNHTDRCAAETPRTDPGFRDR